MTAITKTRRAAAFKILENSAQFDPDTMIIHRDGYVTAVKDADKTFNAPEIDRDIVGHIDDMVTPEGKIQAGY